MKIAQIACVFPPYRGGIGTMAYNHSVSLAAAGHQVEVLTPKYNPKQPDIEEMSGFVVKRYEPRAKYGNGALCPQISKDLEKYDVVHLHYPCFGVAEYVYWAKGKNPQGFKLVLTYHMDVVGSFLLRPLFKLHLKFLMPRIVRIADKVIVTSNDYAAHSKISKLFYTIPGKFVDVPPEVDTQRFSPGQETGELISKHQINRATEKVLLFVGGLDSAHYFKGINFLIDSFKLLQQSGKNPLKLIIVGDGNLRSQYQAKVIEMHLHDSIHFAGPVSAQDLPRYYNLADLVVLPSIDQSEAFGIVLIEAMSCGTPVIASDLPGVRTAMQGAGLTFETLNEGDLAAKLNELLSDPQKLQELGQAARQLALQRYDSKVILKKLLKVYEDLLN